MTIELQIHRQYDISFDLDICQLVARDRENGERYYVSAPVKDMNRVMTALMLRNLADRLDPKPVPE